MNYEIKKAPLEYLSKARNHNRIIPIESMGVGDMIEAENTPYNKTKFYNAIKHRKNYTKECEGWKFVIRTLSEEKIACIRLS